VVICDLDAGCWGSQLRVPPCEFESDRGSQPVSGFDTEEASTPVESRPSLCSDFLSDTYGLVVGSQKLSGDHGVSTGTCFRQSLGIRPEIPWSVWLVDSSICVHSFIHIHSSIFRHACMHACKHAFIQAVSYR
jgi:hypothetical protein